MEWTQTKMLYGMTSDALRLRVHYLVLLTHAADAKNACVMVARVIIWLPFGDCTS